MSNSKNYRVSYRVFESEGYVQKRYFEHFGQAQAYYIHKLVDQVLETTMLQVVRFEKRCEDNRYRPMFESTVSHALELYGMNKGGTRLEPKERSWGGTRLGNKGGRPCREYDPDDLKLASELAGDGDWKGASQVLDCSVSTVKRMKAEGRL